MKKRFLTLLMTLTLCLGLTVPALAAEPQKAWFPAFWIDSDKEVVEQTLDTWTGYTVMMWSFPADTTFTLDEASHYTVLIYKESTNGDGRELVCDLGATGYFNLENGTRYCVVTLYNGETYDQQYVIAGASAAEIWDYGNHTFQEGVKPVLVDEKWNYVDENGQVVDLNRGRFVYVYGFYEGRAAVIDADGKVGYIDRSGNLAVPCQYGSIDNHGEMWTGYFHDGKATVLKYSTASTGGFMEPLVLGTWEIGKIDLNGNLVESFTAVNMGDTFYDKGLYLVADFGMTSEYEDYAYEVELPVQDSGTSQENTVSDWAKDEVEAARAAGLIPDLTGTPNYQDAITREQFAELVVNFMDKSYIFFTGGDESFTDCDNSAVLLAAGAGIVQGVGNGKFDPNATANREQIATMLYRALGYIKTQTGTDLTPKVGSISAYTDKNEVSTWAVEGVGALAANGIMKGTSNTTLSPQSSCTVEQCIILIYRLYEDYLAN